MGRIEMPEEVRFILQKLQQAGYEAFIVGGCVRDSLIGRTPGDWDITTDALPAEIKKVFRNTVDTGIEHGTVTVLVYPDTLEKEGFGKVSSPSIHAGKAATYEVTTYRIDGAYSDSRHPDGVTFTSNLREDLRRRDFTINAMAYNDRTGLVDLFEGEKDLERKRICCVGDPDERFDEDALRILRAVRFAAQLGFSIEKKTAEAVTGHASNLKAVSKERIYAELNKLLCSGHAERLQDVFDLGLAPYIAEGFEKTRPFGPGTEAPLGEGERKKESLPSVGQDRRYERYALICRGWEEQDAKQLLRALKADLDTIRHASFAAARVLKPLPSDPYELKKKIAETDPGHFLDLLQLKKSISGMEEYKEACGEEDIDAVIRTCKGILERREPVYLKDLVVTGDDLVKAGMPAGPGVGKLLERMLDEVRREPSKNSVIYLFGKYLGYGTK